MKSNNPTNTPCPTCNGTNTYNGQPWAEGVGVCIDPFHKALAEAPATPANNPNPTCRYCWDKGYASVIDGTIAYPDMPGDKYYKGPLTERKIYCERCELGRQMFREAHPEALPNADAPQGAETSAAPQPLNNLDELDDWFYRHASKEPDDTETLVLHENYGWEEAKAELQRLITAARVEELDFTIDTDEQGGDYIRFFDDREPIRGDKRIIRFMYDRLREAK